MNSDLSDDCNDSCLFAISVFYVCVSKDVCSLFHLSGCLLLFMSLFMC